MSFFSKKYDEKFLVAILVLVFVGIVFQFSASSKLNVSSIDHYNPNFYLKSHLIRLLIAVFVALPFYFIDYKKLKNYAPAFLFLSLSSLIAALVYYVMTGPHDPGDTARWLPLGFMSIQPSEFAKLALIIFSAAFYEDYREKLNNFKKGFLPIALFAILIFILIVAGKDFSSAGVTMMIAGLVMVAGGAKLKHWGSSILLFGGLVTGAIAMEKYRRERILDYFRILKGDIPLKELPFQIQQSLVSLGNGQFFGTGLGNSTGKNEYLPEPHTDFIFSIIGEEFGFIGALFVLGLFLFIFIRGLQISFRSDDVFGALLGFGLTSSFFLYALLNIGVTCGLLPVTGLPLPFISYGGSAVLFNAIAAAIILNISKGKMNNKNQLETQVIEIDE